MDKALFNKQYGLQSAVLEGLKTQTRRIIPLTPEDEEYLSTAFDWELRESVIIERYARYKVGEEVAVAQSYEDIYMEKNAPCPIPDEYRLNAYNKGFNQGHKGWKNKLFVRPADMPFRIKITNVRVERLQDISNEDCLKEGIRKVNYDTFVVDGIYVYDNGKEDGHYLFDTPREAFATLIDKVSGKGTWESNPWVFVYDFELVR